MTMTLTVKSILLKEEARKHRPKPQGKTSRQLRREAKKHGR